ncbi:hypothetical protein NQZ79_g4993 [Umbelopsis isabellina]|nr:hypothetical protein NQZ79_g4993 [Umbelopsis isabellina]
MSQILKQAQFNTIAVPFWNRNRLPHSLGADWISRHHVLCANGKIRTINSGSNIVTFGICCQHLRRMSYCMAVRYHGTPAYHAHGLHCHGVFSLIFRHDSCDITDVSWDKLDASDSV